MRRGDVGALDASGRWDGAGQASATIRILRRVRLLQMPLVTGAPMVRRFLARLPGRKARFHGVRTWFGDNQGPAHQHERGKPGDVISPHVFRLAKAARKMKTPSRTCDVRLIAISHSLEHRTAAAF